MARIELVPEVFDDFDRFFDHLEQFEVEDIAGRIAEIIQALQILTHSPLIGRKVPGGMRELVIGEANRAYLALYRFVAEVDTVIVLALRSQRESSYQRRR